MSHTPRKETVDAMWQDAREEIRKRTSVDIGSDTASLPEEIIQELETKYSHKEHSQKREKMTQVMKNVLQAIYKIGNVAAEGVSTVFGAAGMCFNAVSILVDGVAQIKKLHSDLIGMFEAIESLLNEFQTLKEIEGYFQKADQITLPDPLVINTNKLMCCFARLCVFTLDEMKGGTKRRWAKGAAAFVGDDGGAQDELDKFRMLVAQKNSFAINIILEETLKSRDDMRQVHEEVSQTNDAVLGQMEKEDKRKQLDNLLKSLSLGEESKNTPRDQRTKLEKIKRERVAHTGKWLEDNQSYQDWLTLHRDSDSCLILSGGKGTGKSFITSKIVDDWTDISKNRQCCIAFYFFGEVADRNKVDKGDRNDGKHAFCTALRSMAYQLAERNPSYLRELVSLIQKPGFNDSKNNAVELWSQLGFARENRDATFVLVFDGLEKLDKAEEFLGVLYDTSPGFYENRQDTSDGSVSATSKSIKLKILIAMDREKILRKTRNSVKRTILLSSEGKKTDLTRFIDVKLQKSHNLEHVLKKDEELSNSFKEKLLSDFEGQYTFISSHIDIVNQQVSDNPGSEELRKFMLSDPRKAQIDAAQQVLQTLQTNFSSNEIAQINDVLLWLVWGLHLDNKKYVDELTMEQVEAITRLEAPKKEIAQPFTQKIEVRPDYRELFTIRPSGSKKQVSIPKYILTKFRENDNSAARGSLATEFTENASISLEITIQNAKAPIVRRFLWDTLEKMSFDKSFFAMPYNDGEQKKIRADRIESYQKIIMHCTSLLIFEADDSTKALLRHCTENLPHYLTRAKKLELEIRKSQPGYILPQAREIVLNLIDVLDGNTLVEHLHRANAPRYDWFSEENIGSFKWWLSEDRCRNLEKPLRPVYINKRNQLCPKDTVAEFLQPTTEQVASKWLKEGTWDAAFNWIDRFLLEMWPRVSKDSVKSKSIPGLASSLEKTTREQHNRSEVSEKAKASNATEISEKAPFHYSHDTPVEDRIQKAAQWAMDVLKINDGRLVAGPLGRTYLDNDCIERAIAVLEPAAAQGGTSSFEIYDSLARAYKNYPDHEKAIKAQKAAIDSLLESDDKGKICRLRGARHTLACLYQDADRLDEALKELRQQLESDPFDAQSAYQMFMLCWREHRFDMAASWFTKLAKHQGGNEARNRPLSPLANMFYENASRSDISGTNILELGSRVATLEYIVQGLETAFKYLSERKETNKTTDGFALTKLQLNIGIAISLQQPNLEGTLREIKCLKSADEIDSDESWMKLRRYRMAKCKYNQIVANDSKDRASKELKNLEAGAHQPFDDFWSPKSLLVHHLATSGQIKEAERSLRRHITNSLELLLDIDPRNDIWAYVGLGRGLGCINDVSNSLAAWSLVESFQSRWWQENDSSVVSQPEPPEAAQQQENDTNKCSTTIDDTQREELRTDNPTDTATDQDLQETQALIDISNHDSNGIPLDKTKITSQETGSSQPTLSEAVSAQKLSKLQAFASRDPGLYFMICDGGCGKGWQYANDFWTCQVCAEIDLCSGCYEKINNGKLAIVKCSRLHHFLYVPPRSPETQSRIGEDEVLIPYQADSENLSTTGGKLKKIKDWLNEIRDRFGIERPEPAHPFTPLKNVSSVDTITRVKSPDEILPNTATLNDRCEQETALPP